VNGNSVGPTSPVAGNCSAYQFGGECACTHACANGGSCVCGACSCLAGTGGANCSELLGCDGVLSYTPLSVDVCGVCGGNGSSCLGCDGKPHGATLDRCGNCGGDGTECVYNQCPFTDCTDCVAREECGWCTTSGQCVPIASRTDAVCSSTDFLTETCSAFLNSVPTYAKVLGAGAVAGIAIGAAVAAALLIFGGKKGYDVWLSHGGGFSGGANVNPLYAASPNTGNNPLYGA